METEKFNGAGLTLIYNNNSTYEILLAKSNSNNKIKKHVWIFPGGRKNDSEKPYETAYREFVEEVFNVVVPFDIIEEIIDLIKENKSKMNLLDINTIVPVKYNHDIPSYTFVQNAEAITLFVDVLNKHMIKSDVFPFGYENLYNSKRIVDIHQFCMQRRYINEVASYEKNELVFITMIPIKNIMNSIRRVKFGPVFHYHGQNLKLHVPTTLKELNNMINEMYVDKLFDKSENLNIVKKEDNLFSEPDTNKDTNKDTSKDDKIDELTTLVMKKCIIDNKSNT